MEMRLAYFKLAYLKNVPSLRTCTVGTIVIVPSSLGFLSKFLMWIATQNSDYMHFASKSTLNYPYASTLIFRHLTRINLPWLEWLLYSLEGHRVLARPYYDPPGCLRSPIACHAGDDGASSIGSLKPLLFGGLPGTQACVKGGCARYKLASEDVT